MRFLADMGVDVRIVEWLRRQGHDAVHLPEEGLHRAPDEQIFGKAPAESRIVLTFDLDFSDLAALAHGRPARVILLSGSQRCCRRPRMPLSAARSWWSKRRVIAFDTYRLERPSLEVRVTQEGEMDKWNIGILVFDDVEILDFAGPFEVFSRTRLVPGPESSRWRCSGRRATRSM